MFSMFMEIQRDFVISSGCFYLWNTSLETEFSKSVLKICDPPTPHPLKTLWRFFAKLVLPRKQLLNITVGFSKNVHGGSIFKSKICSVSLLYLFFKHFLKNFCTMNPFHSSTGLETGCEPVLLLWKSELNIVNISHRQDFSPSSITNRFLDKLEMF